MSKFLWSPIRRANLSCIACFAVPFARVAGVQHLTCPAITAVQHSASRYRCLTSPPHTPCTVNLGSIQASDARRHSYTRRCGDQPEPAMMVATFDQNYSHSQCIFIVLPLQCPMCCNASNMMIHCGVRPPFSTATSLWS